MTVSISGNLARGAQMRVGANGRALLYLLVDAGGALPFEAILERGATPADLTEASAQAAAWRRGAHAVAVAQGVRYRDDHDVAALVMTGLTALTVDGILAFSAVR